VSAGDVYTYTPERRHCTEGLAIENEHGKLIDWFWGGSYDSLTSKYVGSDATNLTLIANLGDYELTPRGGRESNHDYAEKDRLVIHSQHGLQKTFYVRKGSKPDLATKIDNARWQVQEAEADLHAAQRTLDRAEAELSMLEAQAAA
jgi:hypothetical protein